MSFIIYLLESVLIDESDIKVYLGFYGNMNLSEDFVVDLNEGVIII